MSNLRLSSLILLTIFAVGCGDSNTNLGKDAGICGCTRPSDCSSGVCCVDFSANFGGSATGTCVAAAVDCKATFGVDGGKTIACDKDSDCANEPHPDGGTHGGALTCGASSLTGSCAPKLCR